MALRDELTQLYNRRGFFFAAEQYLLHARRAKERALLFFFDIDGLKIINDTQGHCAGDVLIRDAGDVLKRSFREEDIVARLGGDEFIALAIDATNSQAVLRRISHELQRSKVSFSSGVTVFDPTSADTLETMIQRADANMYMQKRDRKAV